MTSNIVSLIRKDFYVLFSEKKIALLILALVFVSYGASLSPFMGLYFIFMIVSIYIQNIFNLDEKYRAEKFFVSLPVRRRELVLARYGGIMAITAIHFVFAYLWNIVFIYLFKVKAQLIPIGYFASAIMIVSLITSITIPLYFKYSFVKAKNIIMPFFFVFFALLTISALETQGLAPSFTRAILAFLKSPFPQDMMNTLQLIGISIIMFGFSIYLAVAAYSKKDL